MGSHRNAAIFIGKDVFKMTAADRLLLNDYENVAIFTGEYTYDTALVGVTEDERAVYDFDKMVTWLAQYEGVDELTAMDWLGHELLLVLQEMGPDGPIIFYPFME